MCVCLCVSLCVCVFVCAPWLAGCVPCITLHAWLACSIAYVCVCVCAYRLHGCSLASAFLCVCQQKFWYEYHARVHTPTPTHTHTGQIMQLHLYMHLYTCPGTRLSSCRGRGCKPSYVRVCVCVCVSDGQPGVGQVVHVTVTAAHLPGYEAHPFHTLQVRRKHTHTQTHTCARCANMYT